MIFSNTSTRQHRPMKAMTTTSAAGFPLSTSRSQDAHRQFRDLRERNPDSPAYRGGDKMSLGNYYDLSDSAAYYAAEILQL